MIMMSAHDKEEVTKSIKAGNIDAAIGNEANLVDEVLLAMNRNGVIGGIEKYITDKRERRGIPFQMVLTLGIAAKMKIASSLTDIPFAIRSAKTLGELGYCMWDTQRDIGKGLMDEGSIRKLVEKYEPEDWLEGYNGYVQQHVLPTLDILPDIHILDVTELEVKLDNDRYEGSEVTKHGVGAAAKRGYKLATLRGLSGDRGFIEEIRFGNIKDHDLKLSEDMLCTTAMFKQSDILMMDRGFIDRDMINLLKSQRGVDVYIPLRKNMVAYNEAVAIAKKEAEWAPHPNPKRKSQVIMRVTDLGVFWRSERPEKDVDLTGCVVWDKKKDEYYVFVTTDTNTTARRLISTYELRPEIEEDYRQIKDFWNIESFGSRKLTVIVFHILCVLLGYLYFQLFALTLEGERWAGKSLPVALKKYTEKEPICVIICVGQFFAIYPLLEIMQLYAALDADTRARLDGVLSSA